MPLSTKPFVVLTPGEAIDADTRCQGCIQNSTTLAYACVLIRRGDFELARHALEVLRQGKAEIVSEVAATLEAWIEIETHNFGKAKSILQARLQRQPADNVALSLLQACLVLESEHRDAQPTPSPAIPPLVERDPIPPLPTPSPSEPLPPNPIVAPSGAVEAAPIPDSEMAAYQAVFADPQTWAFELWDHRGASRLASRVESVNPLAQLIPGEFPIALTESVARLDGGDVQKVCMSFEQLTVVTWHGPEMNAALVTGPIQQALLTMVRAENVFQKRRVKASGSASGSVEAA